MTRCCQKAGSKKQALDPKLVSKQNGPTGKPFGPRIMLGLVEKPWSQSRVPTLAMPPSSIDSFM